MSTPLDPFALYYPDIHIRDDTWLKYAALYWPKMARLRPNGYPTDDSTVARVLQDEARWLIDLTPPAWAAADVGEPFLQLINAHAVTLRNRFGIDRIPLWSSGRRVPPIGWSNIASVDRAGYSYELLDPALGYIHASKIDIGVAAMLEDFGLAVIEPGRGGQWVGMHPELASAYICALTERIATEDRLHPVSNQVLPHAALSGWTLERLVQTLVDEPLVDANELHRRNTAMRRFRIRRTQDDLLDSFVFLAFETVIPANLDTVPVEKVIEARARFGAELDTFRSYVTDQAQQLAELQDVRDLPVFQEHLRTEVQHVVTMQLTQLRERLRSVGLDSVKAVANIKSVALPPLADAAAQTAGLPPAITGSAALAACVLSAPVQWRRQRRDAIRACPVGYLFQLERKLNPATMIEKLRSSWPRR
ncbi:DUF6236 family protein [Amycolatopsis sp. cmx-4-83]|uniref:DUF6236 family protein n=1 Tax=Amycolatopsis sp. cmx-4-83 TaxID=2790940 RepID=UPI00397B25A8